MTSPRDSITFAVFCEPAGGGSKRVFLNKRTGRPIIAPDNPAAVKTWRNEVASAAMVARGAGFELLDGPLFLDVMFFLKRPQSHFGRRGGEPYLKPDAPLYCETKPDEDKLTRSTKDALTGVLWTDDARVVLGKYVKVLTRGPVGALLSIGRMPAPTVADNGGRELPSLADLAARGRTA